MFLRVMNFSTPHWGEEPPWGTQEEPRLLPTGKERGSDTWELCLGVKGGAVL